MNIFVLDRDPVQAAEYHCDKHVVKMVLETAQILSTAMHLRGQTFAGQYQPTHRKHPCVVWAARSDVNLGWLRRLGEALAAEYTYRYGRVHKSYERVIQDFPVSCEQQPTVFALCMPDEYKTQDPVTSYRTYYEREKMSILKYTGRAWPHWLRRQQ